jgi:hypothetical protein
MRARLEESGHSQCLSDNRSEWFTMNLSVTIDVQQRLLLVWVDGNTGDLLFSWANSNRANIPLEWTKPIILSFSIKFEQFSRYIGGCLRQIVVVYAVALNENRGVYLTQSNDLGETWSSQSRFLMLFRLVEMA